MVVCNLLLPDALAVAVLQVAVAVAGTMPVAKGASAVVAGWEMAPLLVVKVASGVAVAGVAPQAAQVASGVAVATVSPQAAQVAARSSASTIKAHHVRKHRKRHRHRLATG